eukprot:1136923-Pelagomonas_calceolata.AAC.1
MEAHWLKRAVSPFHQKATEQKGLVGTWKVTRSARLQTWITCLQGTGGIMTRLIKAKPAGLPAPTLMFAIACCFEGLRSPANLQVLNLHFVPTIAVLLHGAAGPIAGPNKLQGFCQQHAKLLYVMEVLEKGCIGAIKHSTSDSSIPLKQFKFLSCPSEPTTALRAEGHCSTRRRTTTARVEAPSDCVLANFSVQGKVAFGEWLRVGVQAQFGHSQNVPLVKES